MPIVRGGDSVVEGILVIKNHIFVRFPFSEINLYVKKVDVSGKSVKHGVFARGLNVV